MLISLTLGIFCLFAETVAPQNCIKIICFLLFWDHAWLHLGFRFTPGCSQITPSLYLLGYVLGRGPGSIMSIPLEWLFLPVVETLHLFTSRNTAVEQT